MNTPIAKLLRRARPLVLAAAALASAGVASATALTLTVATDTPLRMSGAVTGSVYDTPYSAALDHIATTGGGWFNLSSFDLPVVGNNWHAWGTVYEADYHDANGALIGTTWDITLHGQHMVAPHPDEIAPNGLVLTTLSNNLEGLSFSGVAFSTSKLVDTQPHLVTAHEDRMVLAPFDLNGGAAGSIGSGGQLAASFVLTHPVPEPGQWALLLAGAAALALLRSARSRRAQD